MIIVEKNVIAYVFITGEHTKKSKTLLMYDSQ